MTPLPRPDATGPVGGLTLNFRWMIPAACLLTWTIGCGGVPVKPASSPSAAAPTASQGSTEPTEATPGTVQGAPPSPILVEAEIRKLDPKTYATRFRRPLFCEMAARALVAVSPSRAWEVLSACVDKGDFKLLERLLEPPWLDALKTRPDAPRLVVKVVAARGGDDARDGALLRAHQVQLFALDSAVKQPAAFGGLLVLLRASVAESRAQSGEATIRLLAEGFTRPEEIHVLGRLPRPDPSLETGRELVLVARFERLEERPSSAARPGERVAVLSLVGYSELAGKIVD